jgi:hypothetical protein
MKRSENPGLRRGQELFFLGIATPDSRPGGPLSGLQRGAGNLQQLKTRRHIYFG